MVCVRGFAWVSLFAGILPAQQANGADVLAALDRWTASYLAGNIDVTNASEAMPRLPLRLVANPARPLGELLQFQQLVAAAIEVGSRAATDRLLRLVDVGFDEDGGWSWDQRVVRDVVEAAIGRAGPDVAWHLFAIAREPEGDASRRVAALHLLGDPRHRLVAKTLAVVLADPLPCVRATAAIALGAMGEPGVLPALAMMLHVEDDDALVAAALASVEALFDAEPTGIGVASGRSLSIRAGAAALTRVRDHAVALALVRFLDAHRSSDAIPALITVLERVATARPAHPVGARQQRDLRRTVHRALQAMTGAVLGEADVHGWRRLWESGGCAVVVRPPPAAVAIDTATAARRRDGGDGFFGVPVTGRRVVFVIDASGSMMQSILRRPAGAHARPSRFDIAVRELGVAIEALESDACFNVVVFRASARTVWKEPVAATVENKARAIGWVAAFSPGGSTSLWEALALGLGMTTLGADGEPVPVDEIFVLSDGIASGGSSGASSANPMRVVRLARERGIRIHCVAIDAGGDGGLLREIAERSDGQFVRLGARPGEGSAAPGPGLTRSGVRLRILRTLQTLCGDSVAQEEASASATPSLRPDSIP